MKTLVMVLSSLIVTVSSQRPMYAGQRPIRYPDLANRFKNENETSSTTATLPNRFGTSESSTSKLPVDARGDQQLVDRLNQWPEQNRPFWLLNAQHIEKHRGSATNANNNLPNSNSNQSQNSRRGGLISNNQDLSNQPSTNQGFFNQPPTNQGFSNQPSNSQGFNDEDPVENQRDIFRQQNGQSFQTQNFN